MFTIEQVNEIKKALHYCGNALGCEECPYNKVTCCQDKLNKDAMALILDYEDTIQQLEAEADKQYEQAEADILGNMADGGTSCHWCIAKHKSEARKDLAERLNDTKFKHGSDYMIYADNIDTIVKEIENGR